MQFHIECKQKASPQNEYEHVELSELLLQMPFHIGCMQMVFLQDEQHLYGRSIDFDQQRPFHIVYMRKASLPKDTIMSSQVPFLCERFSTLTA